MFEKYLVEIRLGFSSVTNGSLNNYGITANEYFVIADANYYLINSSEGLYLDPSFGFIFQNVHSSDTGSTLYLFTDYGLSTGYTMNVDELLSVGVHSNILFERGISLIFSTDLKFRL